MWNSSFTINYNKNFINGTAKTISDNLLFYSQQLRSDENVSAGGNIIRYSGGRALFIFQTLDFRSIDFADFRIDMQAGGPNISTGFSGISETSFGLLAVDENDLKTLNYDVLASKFVPWETVMQQYRVRGYSVSRTQLLPVGYNLIGRGFLESTIGTERTSSISLMNNFGFINFEKPILLAVLFDVNTSGNYASLTSITFVPGSIFLRQFTSGMGFVNTAISIMGRWIVDDIANALNKKPEVISRIIVDSINNAFLLPSLNVGQLLTIFNDVILMEEDEFFANIIKTNFF